MKHPQHKPRALFWRMWGWPLALGLLTAGGLVSALFSDGGFGDMFSWFALGLPVAVCAWFGWRRQPAR